MEIESSAEIKLQQKVLKLNNQISSLKDSILRLKILNKKKSDQILKLKDDKRKLSKQISVLKANQVLIEADNIKKSKQLKGESIKKFTWANFDKEFPTTGPLIKEVAKHLKIDLCEYKKSEANSWVRIYKKLDEMIRNETTTKIKFENYLKILSKSKLKDWSFKEGEYRPTIKNIVDLVEKYVSIRNYIDSNRDKIL